MKKHISILLLCLLFLFVFPLPSIASDIKPTLSEFVSTKGRAGQKEAVFFRTFITDIYRYSKDNNLPATSLFFDEEVKNELLSAYLNNTGIVAVEEFALKGIYEVPVDFSYLPDFDYSVFDEIKSFLVWVDLSTETETMQVHNGENLHYFMFCKTASSWKVLVHTIPDLTYLNEMGIEEVLLNKILEERLSFLPSAASSVQLLNIWDSGDALWINAANALPAKLKCI